MRVRGNLNNNTYIYTSHITQQRVDIRRYMFLKKIYIQVAIVYSAAPNLIPVSIIGRLRARDQVKQLSIYLEKRELV